MDLVVHLLVYDFLWVSFSSAGSDDTHARVWDLRMLACSHVLRGHLHWVKNAEPVNDHTLVTAGFDGTVRLWDTRQQYCKPLVLSPCLPLWLLTRPSYLASLFPICLYFP